MVLPYLTIKREANDLTENVENKGEKFIIFKEENLMKIKKIFAIAVAVVLTVQMSTAVFASKFTPAPAGDLLETDIKASINGCRINSYNVNGYTAVFAEDLGKYGLDVVWNEQARTVTIARNDMEEFSGNIVFDSEAVTVGKKVGEAYFTDIRAIVKGITVLSYNINGKTAIFFDALKLFGDVSFDEKTRAVTCTIDGLTYKKPLVTITDLEEEKTDTETETVVTPPEVDIIPKEGYYSNGYVPDYNAVTGAKLLNHKEMQNGYVSYTYDNYDEFAADKYITHIVDKDGFVFNKTDQKDTSIIYYYTKGSYAIAIEIETKENTLTITCKK